MTSLVTTLAHQWRKSDPRYATNADAASVLGQIHRHITTTHTKCRHNLHTRSDSQLHYDNPHQMQTQPPYSFRFTTTFPQRKMQTQRTYQYCPRSPRWSAPPRVRDACVCMNFEHHLYDRIPYSCDHSRAHITQRTTSTLTQRTTNTQQTHTHTHNKHTYTHNAHTHTCTQVKT